MCSVLSALSCYLCICICIGSDFKLIFWNLDTADPILEVDVPEQIFCISFSPNGSRLACTAKDKMLRIINTHTGDVISVSY